MSGLGYNLFELHLMTEYRYSALHCLTEKRTKIAITSYTPRPKYGILENILHWKHIIPDDKNIFYGSCILMNYAYQLGTEARLKYLALVSFWSGPSDFLIVRTS